MITNAIGPILHGTWNAVSHTWWLFGLVFGWKLAPRLGRSFMVRRGGMR